MRVLNPAGAGPGMGNPELPRQSAVAEPSAVAEAGTAGSRSDGGESDEILLIAVGNQQHRGAFELLFKRYAKPIFAMGMKLSRNEQLANDLVQEAMFTVWQKAPLYDLDRGTAQSWIFTLTRNRCFDMLRKQKRQPATINADDVWPQEGEHEGNLVHADVASREVEIEQVEQFIDNLPAAQKAVVEQVYLHDRTHEEAAVALNIPLGTLKSRLRLGIGKLKQMIGTEP